MGLRWVPFPVPQMHPEAAHTLLQAAGGQTGPHSHCNGAQAWPTQRAWTTCEPFKLPASDGCGGQYVAATTSPWQLVAVTAPCPASTVPPMAVKSGWERQAHAVDAGGVGWVAGDGVDAGCVGTRADSLPQDKIASATLVTAPYLVTRVEAATSFLERRFPDSDAAWLPLWDLGPRPAGQNQQVPAMVTVISGEAKAGALYAIAGEEIQENLELAGELGAGQLVGTDKDPFHNDWHDW